MTDGPGLRERKKRAARRKIWLAAVALFDARGFDDVSVAEIAEAADVSKMTVFNYFGTKEDIIMSPPEEHVDDTALAVRERAAGQTPQDAVREYFLDRLAARNPVSGLSVAPENRLVVRIIGATPVLMRRYAQYIQQAEERLAAELSNEDGCDEFEARLIAAQIEAVRMNLIRANVIRIQAGETADEIYPDAVAQANRAFALLDDGLAGRLRR